MAVLEGIPFVYPNSLKTQYKRLDFSSTLDIIYRPFGPAEYKQVRNSEARESGSYNEMTNTHPVVPTTDDDDFRSSSSRTVHGLYSFRINGELQLKSTSLWELLSSSSSSLDPSTWVCVN